MIHFYYGDNDFALRRATGDLIARFEQDNGVDAITKINAAEIEPQALLAEIVNASLLAPRRLIVVTVGAMAREFWRTVGDNLARIIDGPNDLLLVAETPDKRTKTFKDLVKSGSVTAREFLRLRSSEMKSWLRDEAHVAGLKIDATAIDELLIATGGDSDQQARLAAEIAKFQSLGRPINVDLVRKIVEPNLATNAFVILNLAIAKQRSKVASELKKLRESGEDANKFFGLLASQIFALAAAIFAGADAETARQMKIHPFQLMKMRDLAGQLGNAMTQKRRIREITRALSETDAHMKLSRADEAWVLIEIFLTRM
jgi:DNA polymerase III delta subunit